MMSLSWNADTWAQVAAHAARVAAHLKEREAVQALKLDLNLQIERTENIGLCDTSLSCIGLSQSSEEIKNIFLQDT